LSTLRAHRQVNPLEQPPEPWVGTQRRKHRIESDEDEGEGMIPLGAVECRERTIRVAEARIYGRDGVTAHIPAAGKPHYLVNCLRASSRRPARARL